MKVHRIENAERALSTSRPPVADRPNRAGAAAFLESALASGPVSVNSLTVTARAAGLLRDHQCVTDAKVFKAAKKQLCIRSVRDGFGNGGEWFWQLPIAATLSDERSGHLCAVPEQMEDAYASAREKCRGATGPSPPGYEQALITSGPSNSAASFWARLIDRLDQCRPPVGIPPYRWAGFIADCYAFMNLPEDWASRAARLGWSAEDLFGFRGVQPLAHLGSAGLLWLVNGGLIIELHREWALVQTPGDGSRRIVNRRRADARGIVLPWTRRQRIGGAN